jgi:uncharacterized membrane protein (DUF2068 family)
LAKALRRHESEDAMTQLRPTMQNGPLTSGGGAWAGWTMFAALMLLVTGGINVIQGLVALLQDDYFLVRSGDQLVLTDFTAWGVVMLVWGALLLVGGLGLWAARGWARWFAVAIACLSILIQIVFLAAQPFWSVLVIALDVAVILALTAHWNEAKI